MLFVLSGPSGSGKTTLCKLIQERLGILHSVSHTTRPKRPGEIDGEHYHFVSASEFDAMIQEGKFAEWAWVHSNRYGTSFAAIEAALKTGGRLVLDLDVQGALAIKSSNIPNTLIFIDVSNETLLERLGNRGSEDPITLKNRLDQADAERVFKDEYDHIITNLDLETAYRDLAAIIKPHLVLAE